MLEESLKVNFEDFITFHKNFLKSVRLELYIGGNITSESALNIANICTSHIFEKRGAISVSKVTFSSFENSIDCLKRF